MRRIAHAVAMVAVCLLLVSAGCYTVLRHPTDSNIVQEGTYYRSCADCHADAAYYHPFGHPYYSYGRSHNRWGSYYGSPWWYDDYWWWDDHHDAHDHEYDGPEVETGTRHLWGSSGWPSSGWGFSPPSGNTVTPPVRPPDPPKPPKLKDAQKKPEKEKQVPPKLKSAQERPKKGARKDPEPAKPEEDEDEKNESVRPRKNPKRGS